MSERGFVSQVREQWANTAQRDMERGGGTARIDHRSYRDIARAATARPAELEPPPKPRETGDMQVRGGRWGHAGVRAYRGTEGVSR